MLFLDFSLFKITFVAIVSISAYAFWGEWGKSVEIKIPLNLQSQEFVLHI